MPDQWMIDREDRLDREQREWQAEQDRRWRVRMLVAGGFSGVITLALVAARLLT